MIRMLKKKYMMNSNLKINIIYIFLIISNIFLFIGLIDYSINNVNIDINTIEIISTIIPTIIILGMITSRLYKLQQEGNSLYKLLSLIMITTVGIMTSYFCHKINTASLFGSYLEMFKILCVILLFVLLSTQLKSMKEIIRGKYTKENILVCLIIFTLLGIFATLFHIDIDGTPANVRCMLVLISGLFGGPFVGIPVGLISGAFRYSIGGSTVLPCTIATVISGIIGSLIFIWNDKKFPKPKTAVILMFLFTGFEMELVVEMTPSYISFPLIFKIYPQMLFAALIGIVLFSMLIRDERKKIYSTRTNEECEDINENEFEENKDIIELKNEIKGLKNQIKDLKEQ